MFRLFKNVKYNKIYVLIYKYTDFFLGIQEFLSMWMKFFELNSKKEILIGFIILYEDDSGYNLMDPNWI
jgi:hypothetical protein